MLLQKFNPKMDCFQHTRLKQCKISYNLYQHKEFQKQNRGREIENNNGSWDMGL